MKTPHLRLLTRLAAILLLAGVVVAAERGQPRNPAVSLLADTPERQAAEDRLLKDSLTKIRDKLVRVTDKARHVSNLNTSVCDAPEGLLFTPHDEFWIHVFINPEAADIIKSGKGTYPEGTIILKQKFLDAEAKQTEFYTGMRKREKDYNPGYGDWEFFTLDSAGTKVTARGKIDSCMDCHANWKETDFVS
jgi:hypothetical protein